mgnify:CR=1 FL=1
MMKRSIHVISYSVMIKIIEAQQELHIPESPPPTATPLALSVFAQSMSSVIVSPGAQRGIHSSFVKYSSFPVCMTFGSSPSGHSMNAAGVGAEVGSPGAGIAGAIVLEGSQVLPHPKGSNS